MPPLSPLAPAAFPAMPPVAGVRLATCEAGVRYHGRTDLTLVELAPGTTAAGVLTRSKTAAAPVDWCRAALADGLGRALVVSAGNANAFTGRAGDAAVRHTAEATAALFATAPEDVFIAQTGVIGEPMDPGKIVAALPGLKAALDANTWHSAAQAIMTTDTFPKGATAATKIDGQTVTINGNRQGLGHDCARHGDHARLRLHRRAAALGGTAEHAEPRQRALV